MIIDASPSSSSRSAAIVAPAERAAPRAASARYAARSSAGSASRWRAHGVDVAARHRSGERGGRRRARRRCRPSPGRAAGTPRAARRRRRRRATAWPEQRDEVVATRCVAAAWYRTRSPGATRNGRMPSDTARRSTVGRARRPRTTSPGAAASADLGRRQATAAGGASRPRRRGGPTRSLSSSSSGHAPERWTTSAPARRPRRERGGGVGDRGVGRGDDHEVGVAAGVGHLRDRSAHRAASAAARADGASDAAPGDRDRRATRARPSAAATRRPGATRDPRGRAPAASTVPCTSDFLALRSSPWCGCRTTRAARNARPVGRTACRRRPGSACRPARVEVGERHEHERPLGHPGVRHLEVGLVDPLVADEQHVDVERPRAPPDGAHPVAVGLEPLRELAAARAGVEVGVDRHDRVEVVVLGRATDRRGLVDRRHRRRPRRRRPRRARRPPAAGARAGHRGSSRSRGTRGASADRRSLLDAHRDVVDHRAHRRVQLAHRHR